MLFAEYNFGYYIKEHGMCLACYMHDKGEKCRQNLNWKTRREQTTLEAEIQRGGSCVKVM
jgi:hypothetical protein